MAPLRSPAPENPSPQNPNRFETHSLTLAAPASHPSLGHHNHPHRHHRRHRCWHLVSTLLPPLCHRRHRRRRLQPHKLAACQTPVQRQRPWCPHPRLHRPLLIANHLPRLAAARVGRRPAALRTFQREDTTGRQDQRRGSSRIVGTVKHRHTAHLEASHARSAHSVGLVNVFGNFRTPPLQRPRGISHADTTTKAPKHQSTKAPKHQSTVAR
jgi:hypothetical protein